MALPIKTSRLGAKLAGGAAAAAPASPVATHLARVVALGRRGEEVVLPVIGAVFMELPGARVWQSIEAEVRAELRRLEADPSDISSAAQYEAELAMRVLSVAAREPSDHAVAIGSIEEWGQVDNDVLNAAWQAFGDVRERLDPVGSTPTDDDLVAISAAVKKKDAMLLRTFGVVKLSHWLATTAELPSTSPIPTSSSTGSSSEP